MSVEEINFGEIQRLLGEILGDTLDFQDMVNRGASGEGVISWKKAVLLGQELFLEEIMEQRSMWLHIFILAAAAAVLIHFADVFQNQSVSQISFCMIYMILFLILMASFRNCMEITRGVLKNMRDFMTVLAPAYFLAMTFTSYISSAGIYYEFILLLISGIRWFMDACILPCIEIYVLLVLVNYLSKDARLSGLSELVSMAVGWSLKAALALVMGFHMIQGLISPAADAFRSSSVSRSIEMVPGVGDAGSSVTDMVLGSAVLIKNGIGAAALVALLFLCLIPLIKLGVIMAAYYVLSAVLQPVSDERITGCLTGMGNGVKLLFRAVFTVLALFLLTVALTAALTGR